MSEPAFAGPCPTNSSPWHFFALVIIVVLAGWLRLGSVGQVGIRTTDESAYVSDAKLWYRCATLLTDAGAVRSVINRDKPAFQRRMEELGIDFNARYGKPSQGYTFLAAAVMLVAGDTPAALLVLNGLCGTLTVLLLYGLAATLVGRPVALMSALLLALSPYHLVYCRSVWPYATAGMFVVAGVWVWALGYMGRMSWPKASLLGGAAIGCGVTCHFSSGYVVGALVLADMLARRWATPSAEFSVVPWRVLYKRWCFLAAGLALPILAIEAVFQFAHLAALTTDSYLPLITYLKAFRHWGEVVFRCQPGSPGGGIIHWQIPSFYAAYFLHWHGLIGGVLLLIGSVVLLRSHGPRRVAAIYPIIVVGLLMFQVSPVARAVSQTVPFACVCIAVGVFAVARSLNKWSPRAGQVMIVALTLLTAVPAGARAWQLYGKKSDIARACALIDRYGGGAVAVPHDTCYRSKYWTYMEGSSATPVQGKPHRMGTPAEVLAKLRGEGIRWMITDPQHWHYNDPTRCWVPEVLQWWDAMGDHLDNNAVLVAEFPHISDYRWEYLAEGSGVQFIDEMKQRGDGPLRVYDLQTRPVSADARTTLTAEAEAYNVARDPSSPHQKRSWQH